MQENIGLARHTTIGTGGPARFFARPETVDELVEALRVGAGARTFRSRRSVSARTCSSHDEGVDALVVKLAGELASAHVDGDVLVAGGGAANAVCLHRARAAGLGGFEFAAAIPGTAGGGVRMNAGAYGSDWRDVMLDAVVVGRRRRAHALASTSSTSCYRHSAPATRRGRRPGALPARSEAARRGQGARRPSCSRAARRPSRRTSARSGASSRTRARSSGAGRADRGVRAQGPPHRRRADLAAARELHRERGRGDLSADASR